MARSGSNARQSPDRQDLVGQVYQSLRERIIANEFGDAGLLPSEGSLGKELGVSRTVIREAMKGLAARGLVEVSQGRRPRVKRADADAAIETLDALLSRTGCDISHLAEARTVLEAEIAALAARRATDDQIDALARLVEQMQKAPTHALAIEADVAFHDMLAQATGNPLFGAMLAAVAGLGRASRRQTLARAGIERTNAGHRRILQALRDRDPQAARTAMGEHLELVRPDAPAD